MHRHSLVIAGALLAALSACGEPSQRQMQAVATTAARHVPPTAPTLGFTIDLAKDSVLYEGEEAQRLAQEVAPVAASRTRSVAVNSMTIIPGNSYTGFGIDIALEPEGSGKSSCVEAHIFISFRFEKPDGASHETRLTLRDGKVLDHRFAEFLPNNRYLRLPGKPVPPDALTEACSKRTDRASKWMSAYEWSRLAEKEQGLKDLMTALRAPTGTTISCVDVDRRPCSRTPAQLMTMLQRIPPQDQDSLRVPGDAYVTVFRYAEPVGMGGIGNDYSITTRSMQPGQMAIRIEFSRNSRPIV